MILTRTREGLLVVRQTDHGDQTGAFASAWGNERVAPLADHVHDAEVAARHHDDGWATWERRPTIDPATGQPVQFLALTPLEHVPLYRAGIERAEHHSPWAGLLVSMHGAGLYNNRYGTFALAEQHFNEEERALVDEFLGDMAAMQDRLLGSTGHRPPADWDGTAGWASAETRVKDLYLLLQVWDRLSLQYAFRLAVDGTIAPVPGAGAGLDCRADGHFRLRLDPYPFVEDRMTFPLVACVVPDRPYAHPEDFLAAVSSAGMMTIECRARAGGA